MILQLRNKFMIGKLKGIIDSIYEDHLILDVSGVGYMVFCCDKLLSELSKLDSISLFIETHVREDHIYLFGFKSIEEKNSFNILQSVSGIGVRMAISILSILSPYDLQQAIDNKNKEAFRSISGIGPKLAERIIVELKGKSFSVSSSIPNSLPKTADHHIASDAISALVNLGIHRNEVINIVNNIMQENPDVSLDNLIRIALQKRSKI